MQFTGDILDWLARQQEGKGASLATFIEPGVRSHAVMRLEEPLEMARADPAQISEFFDAVPRLFRQARSREDVFDSYAHSTPTTSQIPNHRISN